MASALELGRRGLGNSWPNPAVGCIVTKRGRVVGRGWTSPGGRPHAEVNALAEAGSAAEASTVYVTLEPCAHFGHTPPCVDALISSRVARVVIAIEDPDPRTAGKGIARLKGAGIEVSLGVGREQATRDHEGFLSLILRRRPHLTLKLASSLDGRIATATGESRWITHPPARRLVHRMRAEHDAVLIGAGTARLDDPMLDVRNLGVVPRQPVRIVASRRLDLPLESRLGASARQQPVWLCCGEDADEEKKAAWREKGAEVVEIPLGRDRHLQPVQMLEELGQRGITRVFCEGGGALAASLLSAHAVDMLVTFSAGVGLGAEAQPSIGALGVDILADAPRFDLEKVSAIGPDTVAHWRARSVARPSSSPKVGMA